MDEQFTCLLEVTVDDIAKVGVILRQATLLQGTQSRDTEVTVRQHQSTRLSCGMLCD
jgi:hypothetical protein